MKVSENHIVIDSLSNWSYWLKKPVRSQSNLGGHSYAHTNERIVVKITAVGAVEGSNGICGDWKISSTVLKSSINRSLSSSGNPLNVV
jgi:hypothetical protein